MSKILNEMRDVLSSGSALTTPDQLRNWLGYVKLLETASKRCALGKESMGVRIGTFRQILIQLGIIDDISA